jgi:hypothetical protein
MSARASIGLSLPRGLAAAWLVALPLVAAGTWLSHCYLFAIAAPGAHAQAHATDGPEVGLLYRPAFLLMCLALVVLFLGLRTIQSRSPRSAAEIPAWPFGVLAPLGFFVHQHFQHILGSGPMPLSSLVDPSFLLGLLLQLPLGLVTYFLVRLLLRAADRLGRALGGRRRRPARSTRFSTRTAGAGTPRIAALASAGAPRGPPLAA